MEFGWGVRVIFVKWYFGLEVGVVENWVGVDYYEGEFLFYDVNVFVL